MRLGLMALLSAVALRRRAERERPVIYTAFAVFWRDGRLVRGTP